MGRQLALLLCLVFVSFAASSAEGTCAVTQPSSSSFRPGQPYEEWAPRANWYGSDALWTSLPADGVWRTTGNVDKTGGYATKLVFWHKGFQWREEQHPKLIVTAQRIDEDSPLTVADEASAVLITTEVPAMMASLHIPTPGCWRITSQYKGQALTFVVAVRP